MTYSDSKVPLPYDLILEETRLKLAIAKQHLNDLKDFGMTQKWLDDLEQQANEAEQIITNRQQLEELKSLTIAKDIALDACVEWANKLRLRMDLAFKDKSPTGMQFPAKEFRQARKNESKMIALMPSLISIAKQHQTLLKTIGQTSEVIKEGETLLNQLKAANEAQEEYKFSRPTITAQRRQLFKKLYDSVNEINRIGQTIYGTDSPEGLQFRSNWPSHTPSETPETVNSEQ